MDLAPVSVPLPLGLWQLDRRSRSRLECCRWPLEPSLRPSVGLESAQAGRSPSTAAPLGVFVPCPGNAPLRTVGIMTTEVSMPEVEVLSAQECWRLSRSVSVGRLAVWVYDYLDIFPVNLKVDHRALNFRTGVETQLSSAWAGSPIALEADHVSPDEGIAWSVTVKGQATSMERTQEVLDTADLLLTPWETGRRHRLIRVIPDTVGGRRFKISAPLTWSDPLDDATRAGLE